MNNIKITQEQIRDNTIKVYQEHNATNAYQLPTCVKCGTHYPDTKLRVTNDGIYDCCIDVDDTDASEHIWHF